MNEKLKSDRDLAALRKLTARNIPNLETTIQAVRQRGLERGSWLGTPRRILMALLHSVRTRPAVVTAAAAVLAILLGMVVPVSYNRVVGQDVSLAVAGKEIGPEEIAVVARGFKAALGTSRVTVTAVSDDAKPHFLLSAALPQPSDGDVQRSTAEFARELAAKGYSASVWVTPRLERVRYPAVAYAFERIIHISVDGKSAEALEAEIRDRLAQAGVPDAQVSVTDQPDGGRDIRMTVERTREGGVSSAQPEPIPQVVLMKDGAPLAGGEGFSVKIQKKAVDGVTSLVVEVASNGRTARVEVPNSGSMGDLALTQAISSRLRQAGIDAKVTVLGGKISIEQVK